LFFSPNLNTLCFSGSSTKKTQRKRQRDGPYTETFDDSEQVKLRGQLGRQEAESLCRFFPWFTCRYHDTKFSTFGHW